MISLIANKVKTNVCLVSPSLYCTHYLCVPHIYNNNYNSNRLFDILPTQLLTILLTTSSNHDCFVHKQIHTRLTEFLLTVARFFLPFYMRTSSVWWKFLKWDVQGLAFSRILLRLPRCLYNVCNVNILPHACGCWFTSLIYWSMGICVAVCTNCIIRQKDKFCM